LGAAFFSVDAAAGKEEEKNPAATAAVEKSPADKAKVEGEDKDSGPQVEAAEENSEVESGS
jgi:hypothetical protein